MSAGRPLSDDNSKKTQGRADAALAGRLRAMARPQATCPLNLVVRAGSAVSDTQTSDTRRGKELTTHNDISPECCASPPKALPVVPTFITFTGADDHTDVREMIALSKDYPIEWGILFSPSRQGTDPRYPGGEAQSRFAWSGLRLAAHLCGDYSRAIIEDRLDDIVKQIPVDLGIFKRIQVNHRAPDSIRINTFRKGWGPRCIAQTRAAEFPNDTSIDWLFDASGGRGVAPAKWPTYPGRHVGYAGGIGPDNVLAVIDQIAARGPYWIDMESGVRTDDRFDIGLCRRVCEAIYGPVNRINVA